MLLPRLAFAGDISSLPSPMHEIKYRVVITPQIPPLLLTCFFLHCNALHCIELFTKVTCHNYWCYWQWIVRRSICACHLDPLAERGGFLGRKGAQAFILNLCYLSRHAALRKILLTRSSAHDLLSTLASLQCPNLVRGPLKAGLDNAARMPAHSGKVHTEFSASSLCACSQFPVY